MKNTILVVTDRKIRAARRRACRQCPNDRVQFLLKRGGRRVWVCESDTSLEGTVAGYPQ